MNVRNDFDTLAPEFRVRIKGEDLPAAAMADLIELSVIDDVDANGMFTFAISAYDSVEMKIKWIDDDLFREGNAVEIAIGYRDNLQTVFSGEITGLEPEFREGQPPRLTVRGYDRRHRLMRERKTRSFTNIKDSDIANRIAGDAGLTPRVDDSQALLPYVLQHNQTDMEFLLSRAQRIGYEVTVSGQALIFRPRHLKQQEALCLRREIELLEFRPRLTTVGQVEEFVVRGWSVKDKKEIVARAGTGDEPTLMAGSASGPTLGHQAFGKANASSVRLPVQSIEEAEQIAKQRFSEMALEFVRAEGVCIGEPRLRAGTVVKIEGIGKRFSGLYYVTSCEHRYKSRKGYRTFFSAKRNAA